MATRADNLDGSCREVLTGRHAGRWRVQFTFVEDSGVRRRISKLFPTKAEGKAYLQQLRKGERSHEARRLKQPPLGEWFDWLAENDRPETHSEVTVAQRRGRFRNYVLAHFGKSSLSKIDPLNVHVENQINPRYSLVRIHQPHPSSDSLPVLKPFIVAPTQPSSHARPTLHADPRTPLQRLEE